MAARTGGGQNPACVADPKPVLRDSRGPDQCVYVGDPLVTI